LDSGSLRNVVPRARAVPFSAFVGAVVLAAAATAAVPLAGLPGTALPTAFWLLAAVAVIADARLFTFGGRRETLPVVPSVCVTFAVLLAWGLGAAIAVQAAALAVSSYRLGHVWWRAVFNLGQYVLAFAVADLVLQVADLRPYPPDGRLGISQVPVVLLAASAWFAVRLGLLTSGLRIRFGRRWWPLFARALSWESLSYGMLLVPSPLLVVTAAASPALIPLVVVPLYGVHLMARLAENQEAMTLLDPLTGLGNRAAMVGAIGEQIGTRTGPGGADRFALLLLDLDRFRNINDALGQAVGDRLLIEVGRRVRAVAGPRDLVVRLGGDEFALLASRMSGTADARALAGRVVAALAEPVRLDGLPLDVSGSIGIATYPEHGQDVATLMRSAEVAMYDAKQRAAPVAVYCPESDHHTPQRLALLADLRASLSTPDRDGVEMHYQPQVALQTGEVVGVEALLRWHHPTRGTVSPEELIKVTEHTVVMRTLTLRIVDIVVEQLATWAAAGLNLRASVNISIRDLHTGEVAERVVGQLRRYGVPVTQLQLEITEGAVMADPGRVMATIAALERLGVAISLDDFGTGYSSLQHLRRLPLTEVKVDRSFVTHMARDGGDAAIVGSIVNLACSLGLRVVAEGVEDEETWRMLAANGCHVAQGWFIARPMPGDELLSWLARYRPLPAAGVR
jgi:diguanylate cyclase (GGDEF)-like protein